MSRNLCQSSCCGNVVRLGDLRGKPIEFRRYYKYPPHIGTRWDCPTCNTVYFAWWRDPAEYAGTASNDGHGRFVIDLSYYESFNDEHDEPIDVTKPRHLCLDNAEDVQMLWG